MRKPLTAFVLWLCAATVLAGPLGGGGEAFLRGDHATALRLLRPLAEQGDIEAQNILGLMYERGLGVLQDYAEALKWYRKAAEQGDAAAQYNLGVMYRDGQLVPLDYVEAHKWFNLVAARAENKEVRDTAANNRDDVASLLTPAQVAEAQKLAREWKPKQ